jgi:amino acid permease
MFVVGIVTPLAFFTKMHHFQWSSGVAFATVLFVIIAVTVRSVSSMAENWSTFKVPPLWQFSFVGWGSALPLMAFALGCQAQIIPIYGDLKKSIRRLGVMYSIIATSNSLTTVLYMIMSLAGYFHFGTTIDGNVLVSYGSGVKLILVARLMMVLHITLAFPLLIWPARNIIDQLLFGSKEELEPVDGEYKVDEDNNLFSGDWVKTVRHIILTLAIVGLAYGISVAIPNITIVFWIHWLCCRCLHQLYFPCCYVPPSHVYVYYQSRAFFSSYSILTQKTHSCYYLIGIWNLYWFLFHWNAYLSNY